MKPKALPPCPYGDKTKRHELMAIIPATAKHPLTLACSHCGMSMQYRLTWPKRGSKDTMSAAEIRELVNRP